MVNIGRVQFVWSGFPGAPGTTTMYFRDPVAGVAHAHGLLAALMENHPIDVHITAPTSGDMIDPLDGSLVGAWTAGAQGVLVGGIDGVYAAPVGYCINWGTGTILDGHRLVGRSYMVPALSASFSSDGSLLDGAVTSIQTHLNDSIASDAGNMVVWHRPRKASVKHPVDRAGGYSAVSSATVPDKAIVLRSRRS